MEPFSPGSNPLQNQLEQLQSHMNQILEEKKVVTAELSKSENAVNELMEQILMLQKRFKESVKDPSDKQELLTGDQTGEVCKKTLDDRQRELEGDLCRLQEEIPDMEQCLKNLRHYLDLSERQRLRLIAVKEKFLKDGLCKIENEELSPIPTLRRPNMELLSYKIGVKWFPSGASGSSSQLSLTESVSTVVDCCKCSVENITNQSSKVNRDLSLTDCQKMIHHQNITIDDLTTQVYKQKFTISQLTKDLNHIRFLHQQILQMEQKHLSQEMKVSALERQNDVYYISIIKLMEKNDELQKKLSNEQENRPKVLTICKSTTTDAPDRDLAADKFSQTVDVQNHDVNKAIKEVDQEIILKNLTKKDVQLKVMINMIYRQNDRIVSLEQEKKRDDATIDTLKTEINQLTKTNGELTSHFDNLTRSLQTLNGLNEKLTSELLQMRDVQAVAANADLEQLQRENAALVNERDEAVRSSNDLVTKYSNLKNHIGSFRPLVHSRKVQRLRSLMVKMKLKLRKGKALARKRTEQLTELQSNCEVLICNYDDVILQSSELLSQNDELQKNNDKLLCTLDSILIEKEELETRLNKRNQTICACCLKLNREIITLKGNIQHLQNEMDLSEQETTVLKKDFVEIQTKLNAANEKLTVTTKELKIEKNANDKLLKNKIEILNKLDYLDYKYKGTIDKLGKDKSALQSDLNALEQKYANFSDESQKKNLKLQSKILELENGYSTQEEILQAKTVELKLQSDMVQQLTADLEEQSVQLELFQDNNILYKQKIDSIFGKREILEEQLQKTIKQLKRSELKYLSIRKLLVDIESYVAADSSDENSAILNLKVSLKSCQDELFEVEDQLTDSMSMAKCLEEEVANTGENQQKLNRCIIVLVTTWRGVLEKVMGVQLLLDQLSAINLNSFTSLDKTIFQIHEQTCLTIEILATLDYLKLTANGSGEHLTSPQRKCLQK